MDEPASGIDQTDPSAPPDGPRAFEELPAAQESSSRPPSALRAAVLYPAAYTWFVFLSAMDVMFTWTILFFGGREVNKLADYVIRRYGLFGVVALKFGVVVLVLLVCEFVGRRRADTGRRLARWAVLISIIPVTIGFVQLIIAISRMPGIIDGDVPQP